MFIEHLLHAWLREKLGSHQGGLGRSSPVRMSLPLPPRVGQACKARVILPWVPASSTHCGVTGAALTRFTKPRL